VEVILAMTQLVFSPNIQYPEIQLRGRSRTEITFESLLKIIGWDFLEMNEHKAVMKGQNQKYVTVGQYKTE
jgi:hypothetical protein